MLIGEISSEQRKWVLAKIAVNFENSRIGNKTWFEVDKTGKDGVPEPKAQRSIVDKLFVVKKAIKILEEKISEYEKKTKREQEAGYYEIEISRPRFDKLCEEHGIVFRKKLNGALIKSQNTVITENTAKLQELPHTRTAITKSDDNFFYMGIPINFGSETQYKDVFDVIYSNCIQGDIASYKQINSELIKKGWQELPPKKINKRIQNALVNGVFRFSKIDTKKFQNKNPFNGGKLIETIRGKGIKFNNYA
jgi:hypothetical protein